MYVHVRYIAVCTRMYYVCKYNVLRTFNDIL